MQNAKESLPNKTKTMNDDLESIWLDRYGGNYPDTETMCKGDCEGMGVVPVHPKNLMPLDKGDNMRYFKKWEAAQEKEFSVDGWHFVTCNQCNGTGKK